MAACVHPLPPRVNIIIMPLSLDGTDRLICGQNNFDEKYNLDDIEAGVGIGRRCINSLRYADDTTLLAKSKEDLMKLLQTVKKESEKAGLYLNLKNIKTLSNEKIDVFRRGVCPNQLMECSTSGSLDFKHESKHSNETVDKEWLAWQAKAS